MLGFFILRIGPSSGIVVMLFISC